MGKQDCVVGVQPVRSHGPSFTPLTRVNPPENLAGPKTAKSSPVGAHRAVDLGKSEIASLVRGSIKKKKVEWDRGPNRRTVVATGQPHFEPPYLPKVAPGRGGGEGSKSKISSGDDFVSQNDDFTRG